jgi:hypothetical protein
MRTIFTVTLLALISTVSHAQTATLENIPGFIFWNSKVIEETADRLEKELGEKRLVYQTIGNFVGHSVYLVLRGKTSMAELHETESDFQIGVRGTTTFMIGGELLDAELKSRRQQRGKIGPNAKSYTFGPGDFMHIPPNVAHVHIIEPNKPFMYLLFKLNEEPLLLK